MKKKRFLKLFIVSLLLVSFGGLMVGCSAADKEVKLSKNSDLSEKEKELKSLIESKESVKYDLAFYDYNSNSQAVTLVDKSGDYDTEYTYQGNATYPTLGFIKDEKLITYSEEFTNLPKKVIIKERILTDPETTPYVEFKDSSIYIYRQPYITYAQEPISGKVVDKQEKEANSEVDSQ